MYTRPVTRVLARELEAHELDLVAGGPPPSDHATTSWGPGTTDSGEQNLPDDIERITDD